MCPSFIGQTTSPFSRKLGINYIGECESNGPLFWAVEQENTTRTLPTASRILFFASDAIITIWAGQEKYFHASH